MFTVALSSYNTTWTSSQAYIIYILYNPYSSLNIARRVEFDTVFFMFNITFTPPLQIRRMPTIAIQLSGLLWFL